MPIGRMNAGSFEVRHPGGRKFFDSGDNAGGGRSRANDEGTGVRPKRRSLRIVREKLAPLSGQVILVIEDCGPPF
jgi:hypothetical protein